MKKIVLVSLFIIAGAFAYGQNGFFFAASTGFGASSSSFTPLHPWGGSPDGFVPSHQFSGNIGYVKGNWQLETGIYYLKTGVSFVSQTDVPMCGLGNQTNNGPITMPTRFTESNFHINMPVTVGYIIGISRRCDFVPGIGVAMLYNTKNSITSSNTDFAESGYVSPFQDNKMSAELIIKADLGYSVSKHFSITAGPSAQSMFTSLTGKIQGEPMSRVYNYSYLMNFGIRYKLK